MLHYIILLHITYEAHRQPLRPPRLPGQRPAGHSQARTSPNVPSPNVPSQKRTYFLLFCKFVCFVPCFDHISTYLDRILTWLC